MLHEVVRGSLKDALTVAFLALLDSAAFTGNVSFDSMGNRVSINVGFFDVCAPNMSPVCTGADPLLGSGYETDGGGTGWLTTTAPVAPGEKITLKFAIFDEGDHTLDSMPDYLDFYKSLYPFSEDPLFWIP